MALNNVFYYKNQSPGLVIHVCTQGALWSRLGAIVPCENLAIFRNGVLSLGRTLKWKNSGRLDL